MFAVIFPGQGSQLVGMGKDFFDKFDLVKKTLFCFFIMDAPISFKAFRVEFGSSESRKPSISISQFKNEPIIRILWEIDLSPGQITSPDIDWISWDIKFKIYLL